MELKKIWLCLLALVLLAGCAPSGDSRPFNENPADDSANSPLIGIWVSTFELQRAYESEAGFSAAFEEMARNAKNLGANALFVHVRAYGDSVYPSRYFPKCRWDPQEDSDLLSGMIQVCHEKGLAFHAWVNPYRISTTESNRDAAIPNDSALSQLPDRAYCSDGKGLYLNPSDPAVRRLILSGIRELLTYDIDGIHYDDYFYPTADESFDADSYEEYCRQTAVPLNRADWRRAGVNLLISGTHSAVRACGKPVVFSVSPAADLRRNREELYADASFWCREGLVDLIIPQLYFGFDYPNEAFCFDRLCLDWIKATQNTPVRLCVGLAPYKLGIAEGPDAAEWQTGTDVVEKQLRYLKNRPEITGAVFFSYSSLFSEDELHQKQRQAIEKQISKGENSL